jgi:isoquinoline 1-oxidoreductase beta subunit
MNGIIKINRREVLKGGVALGGGLILAWYLPVPGQAASDAKTTVFTPNAFLRLGKDGWVTIIDNKSEMGQGVYTSLPMIVAEELDCDWQKVRVEPAPVNPAYNHTQFGSQITGGSTSVRTEWERLAKAGATARAMLIQAAEKTWRLAPGKCRTEKGQVIHPDGRRLDYGKLAAKAAKLPVPADVPVKAPAGYSLIGRPIHRLDSPAKVNGSAVFGIDVQIPGMLTAVIARPPVYGGTPKHFNDEKAKALPGVMAVVQVTAGVAVAATGFWPANQGRKALEITWDDGPAATFSTEDIRRQFADAARTPGAVARKDGDVAAAMLQAVKKLEVDYDAPYLAHAPMEPLNCVVDLRADGCDVYTGTQMQTGDRNAAARISGLPPEKVNIHTTFLGGGFGRRANPASDFVVEAVEVAKAVGKPVKVIRTREDDMGQGYYRPCWHDRVIAGLDDKGDVVCWQHTIVCQSIMAGTPFEKGIEKGIDPTSVEGVVDSPYAIPHFQVELHSPKLPITVQWFRSVGHSFNAFATESVIDELAHAAGKDPVEFRQRLLARHPRHSNVLETAVKKAGWGQPLPEGHALGVAVHESFGSYIADVAEVSVSTEGYIHVHRMVCVVDCGRIVNPDTIAAQMESGIIFGLTAALYGAITVKDGHIQQKNFDGYPLLSFAQTPKIEVHIIPSAEAPGGIGEPGVPPIAPAVANAVFAATGARVRSLPLTPQKVLEAMKGTTS